MTPNLYDLNSAEGVRQIVAALFQGYNYRLYTEGQTRNQLLDAYRQLSAIKERLPATAGHAEWMRAIQAELDTAGNDLAWWLLGLTNKTAQNLGIRRGDRFDYLDEVARHIREVVANSPDDSFDDAMLMLWAGAATLTIRGSRKSTAGKTLERAFPRAGLTILGLEEETDFWLNMQRDAEVPREIDAENYQVGFIQIRNNRPLTEIHDFLNGKVPKALAEPPADAEGIAAAVKELPDALFVSGLLPVP